VIARISGYLVSKNHFVRVGLLSADCMPLQAAPGVMTMETATPSIKDEARRIVDRLPETASWEDLIYQLYVRQSIEAGLKDADDDRVELVEDVRRSFGLPA